MVFQAPLGGIFVLLRDEVKVPLHEELAKQPAGVVRAVGQDMLGQPDEGQPLGFRVAYEACVAGLSIQVEEPARVCQVLQADVAQQRWWQGARFFLLHWGLSLRSGPPSSSPWASFYPTDHTHSPGIFCTRIPLASGVPAGLWTTITPPQGRLSTSFNACSTSRMRAVGNVPASRSCPVCALIKRAGSSERT